MTSNVIKMQAVSIGSISGDFLKSKIHLIPTLIKEKVEQEINEFASSRLKEIIENNKKRFFFKKKETMEVARNEILEEYDVKGIHSYYYEQEFFKYEMLVMKIEQGSDISIKALKNALNLLENLSILSVEESQSVLNDSLSTQKIETQ